MPRPQFIGEIGGRTGRKLTALEKRLKEREAHAATLERQRRDALELAARLDGELVKLEGASLAGQNRDHELAETRRALAAAQEDAAAVGERELAVAQEAAAVAEKERRSFIDTNHAALLAALRGEGRDLRSSLAEAVERVLSETERARGFEARCIRFAGASSHLTGQSVRGLPQEVEDLRRAVRAVVAAGVPMVEPDRDSVQRDETVRAAA